MRKSPSLLTTAGTIAFIAGCSGSPNVPIGVSSGVPTAGQDVTSPSFLESISRSRLTPAWYRPAPDSAKRGVYVSESSDSVLGYPPKNKKNNSPTCAISTTQANAGIAVDARGNLIVPDDVSSISIYQGPGMCGSRVGNAIADPYGTPYDATSMNALEDPIYVANRLGPSHSSGNVAVCTLSGGCTSTLTNPALQIIIGVTQDASGNVYADGFNDSHVPALVYWAGGTGSGTQITTFSNQNADGLGFDKNGNLFAIDELAPSVHVYSGCPTCVEVQGSPWPLQGLSIFGTVNRKAHSFQAADFINNLVDVYSYPGFMYLYSYSNGLNPSNLVVGIAYNPLAL